MAKELIRKKLHDLGVPSHLNGYSYIKDIINQLCCENKITKFYDYLEEKHSLDKSIFESSIRYAIEVAWKRANYESIEEIFGYSIEQNRGKPTNYEFIITLSECIEEELNNINSL